MESNHDLIKDEQHKFAQQKLEQYESENKVCKTLFTEKMNLQWQNVSQKEKIINDLLRFLYSFNRMTFSTNKHEPEL